MERFSLVRTPEKTPKEFARMLEWKNQSIAPPIEALTQLFEWAKYDRRDLTRADAEAFFAHSRRVIDTLLAASQMR
jgi:hypothetical protein